MVLVRNLKPKVVDADSSFVEKLLREELEKKRYNEIVHC